MRFSKIELLSSLTVSVVVWLFSEIGVDQVTVVCGSNRENSLAGRDTVQDSLRSDRYSGFTGASRLTIGSTTERDREKCVLVCKYYLPVFDSSISRESPPLSLLTMHV